MAGYGRSVTILGSWHGPVLWASEIDGSGDDIPPVARFLMWPGRITLLAGREKLAAKTTLASQAVAAISRGDRFAGLPTMPGVCLWVTEENPETVKLRLERQGADLGNVAVVTIRELIAEALRRGLRNQGEALEALVRQICPVAVVVDTLARFSAGMVAKASESDAWGPLFGHLETCAREVGSAVLVLHHAKKADGTSRDSSAIAAAADAVIEQGKTHASTGRVVSFRVIARTGIHGEDFAIDGFDKATETLTLRALDGSAEDRMREQTRKARQGLRDRVYKFVEANPGSSVSAIRAGVKGNSALIGGALDALARSGLLDVVEAKRNSRLYSVREAQE